MTTTTPVERARAARPEPRILFQSYFKSVGPRTYAAQVKQAGNGNHYIVLTEGRRDEGGQPRKTSLYVFGEDFPAFFRLLKETAEYVKSHPVPEQVMQKRRRFWSVGNQRFASDPAAPASPAARPRTDAPAAPVRTRTTRPGAARAPAHAP